MQAGDGRRDAESPNAAAAGMNLRALSIGWSFFGYMAVVIATKP